MPCWNLRQRTSKYVAKCQKVVSAEGKKVTRGRWWRGCVTSGQSREVSEGCMSEVGVSPREECKERIPGIRNSKAVEGSWRDNRAAGRLVLFVSEELIKYLCGLTLSYQLFFLSFSLLLLIVWKKKNSEVWLPARTQWVVQPWLETTLGPSDFILTWKLCVSKNSLMTKIARNRNSFLFVF